MTAYASLDSSVGDIVLVAINKLDAVPVPARLNISGLRNGTADIYAFADGDASIRRIGGALLTDSSLDVTLPATSMSVIRISGG